MRNPSASRARLNASMTTLPFTDWMGSTTTATARWFSASKLCRGPHRVRPACRGDLQPRRTAQNKPWRLRGGPRTSRRIVGYLDKYMHAWLHEV